jgi:hypothetical protein
VEIMVNLTVPFETLLEAVDKLSAEEKAMLRQRLLETTSENGGYEAKPEPTERIMGLHRGMIWMSDDFDDPLPDEFWFGEDA